MKNNQVILALLNLSALAQATPCKSVTGVSCGPYLPMQYYEIQLMDQKNEYHCWYEVDGTWHVEAALINRTCTSATPDANLWLLDASNCPRCRKSTS